MISEFFSRSFANLHGNVLLATHSTTTQVRCFTRGRGKTYDLEQVALTEDWLLNLSFQVNSSVNVITVPDEIRCEKPPDYDSVALTTSPPSYDDALKLNPAVFLVAPPTTPSTPCFNTSTNESSDLSPPPPAYEVPTLVVVQQSVQSPVTRWFRGL